MINYIYIRKKLIYLFIFIAFGCSSNEENVDTTISGSWQLVSIKSNGTEVHDSCDLQSNMDLFTDNGGIYNQYYSDNPATEPCDLDGAYNVTWLENSSSVFTITIAGAAYSSILNGNYLELTFNDGSDINALQFVKN